MDVLQDLAATVSEVLPYNLPSGWLAYYCVIAWANFVQVVTFFAMIASAVGALRRRWSRPSGQAAEVAEPVAILVPCYLPNEAPIIEETLQHLLNKLAHIRNMTVYLVYNTPKDMPKEEAMLQETAALQATKQRSGSRSAAPHSVSPVAAGGCLQSGAISGAPTPPVGLSPPPSLGGVLEAAAAGSPSSLARSPSPSTEAEDERTLRPEAPGLPLPAAETRHLAHGGANVSGGAESSSASCDEEAQLAELGSTVRLVVQRVAGSTSKAENLNAVIGNLTEDYVAIYDADHCPDADSLSMAIWYLKSSGADCVQGSTYIRKGVYPFKSFVCAEFFMNYFVVLPAMQALTGTGFFGGANGVWRGSSIRQLRFDEQALTEDIDCFARAVVQNKFRFVFMPESCSGELLPAGPIAFWRQRLRWAMGWDEVTLRHATSFLHSDMPVRRRVGLWYIFFGRWLSQLCAVIIVLFNAKAALQNKLLWGAAPPSGGYDNDSLEVPSCVRHLQLLSFYLYLIFISFGVLRASCHAPLSVLPGLVLYFCIMPVYVVFNTVMLSVSLLRVTTGKTGSWVVTARATGVASRKEPLLQKEPHPLLDKCAQRIVANGFATLGAIAGGIVGDVVGTQREEHPLWGFVPFGIGATVTSVTDGRIVAEGVLVGIAVGLAMHVGTMWFVNRRRSAC